MIKIIKSYVSFLELQHFLVENAKYILVLTISLRFLFAFSYGTQDVEWWKAWYFSIEEKGIFEIYGSEDKESIELFSKGFNFNQIRDKTQNVINFEPYKYGRKEYVVTQPPLYIYHLFISGKLYKIFDPSISNNRFYNFFLNLFPIFYSILTSFLIFYFLNGTEFKRIASVSSLFYLLNPLIFLNSPVQGFWDPILAFYVLFSVILLYNRYFIYSFVFLTISLLIKPTAIIILPIYLLFVIMESTFWQTLKAVFFAGVVAFILIIPFIFSNHFISMIIGIFSILDSSNDISRQSLNFWWPIQYYMNFYSSNTTGIYNFFSGNFIWAKDFPVSEVIQLDLKLFSFVLFIIGTSFNLYNFSKFIKINRFYLFYFLSIQVYIYFMLRVGVQNNHYYMMIIFFSVICFFSKKMFNNFLLLILIFFAQDFIFYGFGRDFSIMIGLLSFFGLPVLTVLLSFLNFSFFLFILSRPIKI